MESDPGEKKNIAADFPEMVKRLSHHYDDWYRDISTSGLERLPIPVGHSQHRRVELHAPQAYFDSLQFANGPGFANDWLTQWTDEHASLVRTRCRTGGLYELTLAMRSLVNSPVHLTSGHRGITDRGQTARCRITEIPLLILRPPVEVDIATEERNSRRERSSWRKVALDSLFRPLKCQSLRHGSETCRNPIEGRQVGPPDQQSFLPAPASRQHPLHPR